MKPAYTPDSPTAYVSRQAPASGRYVPDKMASKVAFRAKAFCLMWVRGTLPIATGTFTIEGGRLSGSGELDAAGVDTGIGARNWHLRTSHYLHSKRHPRIEVRVDDADLTSPTIDATIVVRGESKPVRLVVTGIEATGDELKIRAHIDLDRAGLPMLPPIAGVARHVEMTIELVANRVAA